HLEKFSLQLINKSLSSSIIALTLLELISYNQIFSITFWYSIPKQEFQSEFYLFCIRISFLINNPQEDYLDKFIELLKINLSSFNSNIRLLSLYILSSFILDKTNKNHLILNCLQ
ncbi:unnamed protein product, partial [Rotaria sp. Silwood1]